MSESVTNAAEEAGQQPSNWVPGISNPAGISKEFFAKAAESLRSRVNDESEWVPYEDEDRVRTFSHKVEEHVIKVLAVVFAPTKDVFEALWDPAARAQWDEYVQAGKVIEKRQNATHGQVVTMVAPLTVGPRDYCFEQNYECVGKVYTVLMHDCLHDQCPEDPANTRGTLGGSGIIIEPLVTDKDPTGDELTHITMLLDVDMKGWMAYFAVRKCLSEIGMQLNCMPQYLPPELSNEDDSMTSVFNDLYVGLVGRAEKIDQLKLQSEEMKLESEKLQSNAAKLKAKQKAKRASVCAIL
jgi:hypothetical protein